MRAVIYTRVSTKEQSQEGYSLGAQRDACVQWLMAQGADLAHEFCDAGESARTADRPDFQNLLRVLQHDRSIDALVVHRLDRLARNLEDHASIRALLRELGVTLFSVTELLEQTPSGRLVESVLASLAEYYSGNLALEIRKGQLQKLKSGWWPARAPIGYRNVRGTGERREAKVEIDPTQGPLVREAFDLYATGRWPLSALQAHLAEKGLGNDGVPLARSRLASTLANPFYVGTLRWKGVDFPGNHDPLVTTELFDRVQEAIAQNRNGSRSRRNEHHMSGLVYCGVCGSRLCFTIAKKRFEYFFCLGRQRNKASCPSTHVPAGVVDELVADVEQCSRMPVDTLTKLNHAVNAESERRIALNHDTRQQARGELGHLSARKQRLLAAYLGDAISLDDYKAEQSRISASIQRAERLVHLDEERMALARDAIRTALTDLSATTRRPSRARRHRIIQSIHIAADAVTDVRYNEPYAQVLGGSSNDRLVEVMGLEPTTSTLRT